MTLTAPNCPAAQFMPEEIETKLKGISGVKSVRLDIVWDPPWDPSRMSEAARLELGMF
jgi:metal-sulfur cluster biosynthetic enzyme